MDKIYIARDYMILAIKSKKKIGFKKLEFIKTIIKLILQFFVFLNKRYFKV